MDAEDSTVFPSVDPTIGAILVCSWFSFLWMGFIVVMGSTYFINYPRDPLWLKSLVTVLVSMCVVDTVAIGRWSYDWSIINYDSPTVITFIPEEMQIIIAELGVMAFIVQPFYAWRIWLVSKKKNWWLPALIIALSMAQFAIVIWIMVFFSRHDTFAELSGLIPMAYGWLVPCVLSNIGITVGMVYYLGIRVRGASFSSRLSLMQIISRTIQANILSLVCQIVTVALLKLNVGFYFMITDVILTKVYTFSVLSSLNARMACSPGSEANRQPTGGSLPLSSIGTYFRDGSGNSKGRSGPTNVLSMTIDQDELTADAKTWKANASSETQDVPTTRERDAESQKARLVEPGTAV